MIDRTHDLPVARQCQILSLARSTAYYRPQEVSEADLVLMRRIDELHLEHPFAGTRMLRDMLRRDGHSTGRKHVGTLMKEMGIEALYQKPNTSRRHPEHAIYPYLLRNREINRANPCVGCRYQLHPDEARLCVSICGDGLGEPPGAVVAPVEYADDGLLHRGGTGSNSPLWHTGDLQY